MSSTPTMSRLALATLGLGSLAATTAFGPPTKPTPPQQGVGINLANIDRSVAPCEDFYHFANGSWIKNNPVPAAETRWGSFNELADRNIAVEKRILVKAAANRTAKPGTNEQKVGDFYAAAMDSAAIEAAGLQYLQPRLNQIAGLKSLAAIQQYMADPKSFSVGWYGMGVGQDGKKSTEYAVQLRQGGLGLGDRDYYLKEDGRSKTIRTAYKAYMTSIFQLLGDAPSLAATNADAVLALETKLAQASRSRVDLRDRLKNYNKVPVAQAIKDYPNLNLPLRLKDAGLSNAQDVIIGQPEFLAAANELLANTPIADQQQYLRWNLVSDVTPALPKAYGDAAFRFPAGANRGQAAAAPLEALAARHRRRTGRGVRPALRG